MSTFDQTREPLRKARRRQRANAGHSEASTPRTEAPSASQETQHAGEPAHEPHARIGLFTLDRQGRMRSADDTGSDLLGFPADWLVGRAFVVFVARQDVQRFLTALRDSAKSAASVTLNIDLHRGVSTVPVRLTVSALAGRKVAYRIEVLDLSEFTRAEDSFQESLSNWYSLLHNAPDTIMTVTSQGIIKFVNKPLWGYSTHALLDKNLLDYLPESEHVNVLRCLSRSFRYHKRSMCDVAIPGLVFPRWFNLSFGTPHGPADLDGSAITTTMVIREVSEDKRKEETLRASGEHFRDFATKLEAVREEERTRVAREIHDELGQALTALKLELAWVEKQSGQNPQIRKRMKSIIADVDMAIGKVRRISSELRPSILDDLGLIPAIEWQLAKFRKRTQIRTEFLCNAESLSLPSEHSAEIFRVLQEALTNVIRHARATKVIVRLKLLQNALWISIEDNGQGMAKNSELESTSFGIVGMRERVARLGGQFKLFSEPGSGTRLDILVPAKND